LLFSLVARILQKGTRGPAEQVEEIRRVVEAHKGEKARW